MRSRKMVNKPIERIRGRTLQRIRKEHFYRHPLCVHCEDEGRVTLATELDHIIALTNGGTDTPDNKQGLCALHHLTKTAQDLGWKVRPAIGLDGYPV